MWWRSLPVRLLAPEGFGGEDAVAGGAASGVGGGQAGTVHPLHRVLVIDDDVLVRELIAELLTGAGYAVLTAPSGREGMALAKTADLHLILLDYNMPELDGEATAKLLRADPHSRRIPIVALTSAPSSVANRLSRAGCIGVYPEAD